MVAYSHAVNGGASGRRWWATLPVSMLLVASGSCSGGASGDAGDPSLPERVTLTWLSVTNWLVEAGDTRILLDGYVSRIDRTLVENDGTSRGRAAPGDDAVRRVRDAVLPDGELDWILIGHGHWDHAFDTPSWTRLTTARVAGPRTTCLVTRSSGVAPDRCIAVEGGETLDLGTGVHGRVIRWQHSGDSTTANGRRLRAPLELRSSPVTDSAGSIRPGFLEDLPNGGGARAWLITVETRGGPVTILWSNTGNPQAWDTPIPADSSFFREQNIDTSNFEWAASDLSLREHLARAMQAEGIDHVDLWIGLATAEHVRQVASLLRPRAFVPNHWDDYRVPLENGAGTFSNEALRSFLDGAGIRLLVTPDYFDGIALTARGVEPIDGRVLRDRLSIRPTH